MHMLRWVAAAGILAAVQVQAVSMFTEDTARAEDAVHSNEHCPPSPINNAADYGVNYHALWNAEDYAVPFRLDPHLGKEPLAVVTDSGYPAVERTFRSGRAAIRIQIEHEYDWLPSDAFPEIAKSLASLPGPLVQRLPAVTLEFSVRKYPGVGDANAWAQAGNCQGKRQIVVLGGKSAELIQQERGRLEETLVHEFAHVLEHHVWRLGGCKTTTPDIYSAEDSKWADAMSTSACHVSKYAADNPEREDFAESVLAWFAYSAGRHGAMPTNARRALNTLLGVKRRQALNAFMHDRFPAPRSKAKNP